MAQGSFAGTTSNVFITPTIVWNSVVNSNTNTSTVTATLRYSRTNSGYTTSGTWNGSINIGGTITTGSKNVSITYNSNTVAITATVTVAHEDDGTKQLTISAVGAIYGTTLNSTSISATVTLDKIIRASTLNFDIFTIGESSTITITPIRDNAVSTITYSFGTISGTIITESAATSVSWTPPTTFYNVIPDSTSGTGEFTISTYVGNELTGEQTYTFTAQIGNSILPIIDNVTITPINTNATLASWSAFVANYTAVTINVTAKASEGSSIIGYNISGDLGNGSTNPWTSNIVNSAGDKSYTITVTDKRGLTAEYTATETFYSCVIPSINSLKYTRGVYSAGVWTENSLGADIKIVFNLELGLTNYGNTATITISQDGNTLQTISNVSSGAQTICQTGIGTDTISTLTIKAVDLLEENGSKSTVIPTVEVPLNMNFALPGVCFGGVAQDTKTVTSEWPVKVNEDLTVTGNIIAPNITPDTEFSTTSEKPVQNKVITSALQSALAYEEIFSGSSQITTSYSYTITNGMDFKYIFLHGTVGGGSYIMATAIPVDFVTSSGINISLSDISSYTNMKATKSGNNIILTCNGLSGTSYMKFIAGIKPIQLEISQPAVPEGDTLEDCSWANISAVSKTGNASSYWSVGDTKSFTVGGVTYTAVILDFNHDTDSSGNSIGITFGMKNCLADEYQFNTSNSNTLGWSAPLFTTLNGTILSSLESDLQDVIIPAQKSITAGGSNTSLIWDNVALWLLSESEVFDSVSNSVVSGTQYPYYETSGNRIKYLSNGSGALDSWYLRSPKSGYSTAYCCVEKDGSIDSWTAAVYCGLSFCFCV